jgi:protein-disulfide isomerase
VKKTFPLAAAIDAAASLATLVVAVLAAFVLARNLWLDPKDVNAATNSATGVSAEVSSPTNKTIALKGRRKSVGRSKVAIVEFSDFQCPYCGSYARETFPRIASSLVDTGRTDYVFRHLPLEKIHPLALDAAVAAECAGDQGRFWDAHDRIFADQTALSAEVLDGFPQAWSLDRVRFEACRKDAARVKQDGAEALQLGVTATPTFLVGVKEPGDKLRVTRTITGAASVDELTAAVEEAERAIGR